MSSVSETIDDVAQGNSGSAPSEDEAEIRPLYDDPLSSVRSIMVGLVATARHAWLLGTLKNRYITLPEAAHDFNGMRPRFDGSVRDYGEELRVQIDKVYEHSVRPICDERCPGSCHGFQALFDIRTLVTKSEDGTRLFNRENEEKLHKTVLACLLTPAELYNISEDFFNPPYDPRPS